MLKRTFDFLASLVGLALLAPFGLLVALAIKVRFARAGFFSPGARRTQTFVRFGSTSSARWSPTLRHAVGN